MPNKDKNISKRRFKAFENADAWELRKLGELGTLKNGMNFSKDAMGIGFPFINLQNIFGKNIVDVSQLGLAKASSIQLKNYNLQKGDVLFVRSSVKLEGVGEAAIVPKNLENTTYSGFIIRYRDSFGLDYNFKRFIFGTSNIRNQIMSQATDSANKNISQQVLTELDILVPTLLEQNAIGTFFSILDQQITLHQRKLDKLKHVKQAYLSEMFPAEGERMPKRRFPGFTDAWELRRFSELAEIRRGLTYSPTSIRKEGIRVLRSSNIDEDTFTFGEDDVFVDKGVVKIPLVKEGDILITAANGSSRLVGKHTIIKGLPANSTVHGGFMLLASCRNPEFVNSLMSSEWYNKFISLYVAGGNGAIGNLNKNDLDNQLVVVPSTSEQSA
ncbi:restriction endonuclease subunit S, partial [Streptococcus suis]|nr:restriction endonuclease subunit S [Streptococcus suis]